MQPRATPTPIELESLPGTERATPLDAVRVLRDAALFAGCSTEILASLLPWLEAVEIPARRNVFEAGDDAKHLFLIVAGEVEISSPGTAPVVLSAGHFGIEAGADRVSYVFDAVAQTPLSLARIPREALGQLEEKAPAVRAALYRELVDLLAGRSTRQAAATKTVKAGASISTSKLVGWALTVIVPMMLLAIGTPVLKLGQNAAVFSAFFAAAIIMWIFTLVDEYVPGLLVVLAALMMALVPQQLVLSGFVSDGFFEAMSILGLGVVLVSSGLSFRVLLRLLLWLPNRPFWQGIGLLFVGFVLTPVVPSNNARVVLIRPFVEQMTKLLGLRPRGRAATGLAVWAFTGVNVLTSVVLSAKSVNFVVLGLLSPQGRLQFQWLSWLQAASVTGLFMVTFQFIGTLLFFRSNEQPRLSRTQVTAQVKLLGPLSSAEWAAIGASVVFGIGIVTTSASKIHPPWLALTVLYALLLLRFLDKNQFRERIDWPFLIYLGSMAGIVKAFNYLKLDELLALVLQPLGSMMQHDFALFILVLCVILFVVRLAMPSSPTAALAAAIFMPLADRNGVNPWVVGFIVLVVSELWVFPYQCSYYLQFRELQSEKPIYHEGRFLIYNLLMNVGKVVAIYLSIPFWKHLGLL